MASVNDQLQDKITEHSVYVERLKAQTVRKLIALLNRSEDDLIDQIRRRAARIAERGFDAGPATTERLDKLLANIKRLNADAYAKVSQELNSDLKELASYEASWSYTLLTDTIPESIVVQLGVTRPDLRSIYSIVNARPFQGRLLSESLAGVEANRAALVRDAIRQGLVEGETIDQITRRLKGTRKAKYADGLLDRPRRELQALTRTAVAHTANVARQQTYLDNADILRGVQYNAVIDGRVTIRCASLDSKVFPVDSGPRPPQHWNCRSTVTPVTKSYRELGLDLDEVEPGTRATMDGALPEDITYSKWLARKPAAFQDEVLGKAKGKLFRQGGLPLDKFTDRAGNELTLDMLKQKHPANWSKAGLD